MVEFGIIQQKAQALGERSPAPERCTSSEKERTRGKAKNSFAETQSISKPATHAPLLGKLQTWNKTVLGLLAFLPFVASKQPQTEQTLPRKQQRHLALEHQTQSWLVSLLTVPRQSLSPAATDDLSAPELLPPHLCL